MNGCLNHITNTMTLTGTITGVPNYLTLHKKILKKIFIYFFFWRRFGCFWQAGRGRGPRSPWEMLVVRFGEGGGAGGGGAVPLPPNICTFRRIWID